MSNTPFDLITHCQSKDILVEAYSPVAHGEMLKNQDIRAMAEKYSMTVPLFAAWYAALAQDSQPRPYAQQR